MYQFESNGGLFGYNTREYLVSGRLDHQFSERNQVHIRYNYGHDREENPDVHVDVRWNSRVARDEFRIVDSEGEIDLTPLNEPQLVSPAGREELPNHPNLHAPCLKNFIEAVADGRSLLSSGATALWTDWVTERAITTGKK